MAHQCWEPFIWTVLNNLLSVFCNNYDTIFGHGNMNCLEVRAELLKDWLASPYCLGIWDAVIIECENYLACVMVAIFLFYPMVKQEILSTTFVWIQILRLFIMYHLLLYILDILHFYSFKFTYIRCDNMCFFIVLLPEASLAIGYCHHRLRLWVCVCVCQSRACPHDNSSPSQARITKFGPEMQNTLVWLPIVLEDYRPWSSRSNLTWKSNFTSFWACSHHYSSAIQARISKFGPKMHLSTVKIPTNFGLDWFWSSLSFSILKPIFSTKFICALFVYI